jgi:limonene-1,2-epoxide hydrolase
MSVAAFLEIVETEDGDVVLRRADSTVGTSEPLVAIRFSAEAKALLGSHLGDIARGMIGTGVQMAGQLLASSAIALEDDTPHVLH